MSDEEKAHYKRASGKQNRGNQSGASSRDFCAGKISIKKSSHGVSLSDIERDKRKDEEEKVFMEQTIKYMVSFRLENNGELF